MININKQKIKIAKGRKWEKIGVRRKKGRYEGSKGAHTPQKYIIKSIFLVIVRPNADTTLISSGRHKIIKE